LSVYNKHRGHSAYFCEDQLEWVYEEDQEPIQTEPQKPCVLCGKSFEFGTPDVCLGYLPGVRNACCGHGDKENAYVQFENGLVIRGFDVIDSGGVF